MVILNIIHKIELQYIKYLNNCLFKTFLTSLIHIQNIANSYILRWYYIGFVFLHRIVRSLRIRRDFCCLKRISAVVSTYGVSVLLASLYSSEMPNFGLLLWGKNHIEQLNTTPEPHHENGDINRNVRSISFSTLETWSYESVPNNKIFSYI